ncbi:fatty acid desaturase [Marinobacter sp.]|uniref:fatty acid desaturase family protein n=1 Tax=Marinobacter sp. TaxID=50741 RepID=UPI0035645577
MSKDVQTPNREAAELAKKYMGHVSWPTIVLVVLVLSGFVISLGLYAEGLMSAWITVLILAALTYMSYTPLHEAVHGNIHGKYEHLRWLNNACGYLMAPLIAIPYASHRMEHFTHHRYTNQGDKDPDYMIRGMGKGAIGALVTVAKFLWLQNTFFITTHWQKATVKERATYCAEVAVSLGWRMVFIMSVDVASAWWVLLSGYFLGGLFTAYWFAYRPHIPYQESARYRNTNSLIMPVWMRPVGWFWLGQNLHSVHHLFPRVPFYRYHALHDDIEPILREQGTPIVGIFSRKPVPAKRH